MVQSHFCTCSSVVRASSQQLVAEGYISETIPGVAGSIPACVREMGLISGLCDQTFPEKTLVYEDGPRKVCVFNYGFPK